MTDAPLWLCPDLVFDGQSLQPGLAVGMVGGVVTGLRPASEVQARRVAGVITPGYIDLQVNGGGGVMLNNQPTPQAMAVMAAALRRFGTVAILPTVITDAPEVLAKAVDAVLAAKAMPGILGLHIEGPHIGLSRRGTHAAEFVRPLDDVTIAHVKRLRDAGVAVMITLAPEAVRPGQVAQLVALGAIVSIGHSDAAEAEVLAMLAEGASCFTHLFNAMSPMQGRAPGVTGAAINSTAACGFICDGHHVADAMLGLAIRARPQPDRMFLVSDCMSTVGGADSFVLYGQDIQVQGGRLVNAEGSLAGAHVTMAESVARLITVLGIAPEQGLRMAISVPAAVIGAQAMAQIIRRRAEDLLVLGADWLPVATCAEVLAKAP